MFQDLTGQIVGFKDFGLQGKSDLCLSEYTLRDGRVLKSLCHFAWEPEIRYRVDAEKLFFAGVTRENLIKFGFPAFTIPTWLMTDNTGDWNKLSNKLTTA